MGSSPGIVSTDEVLMIMAFCIRIFLVHRQAPFY
uniref:Uncharacterized protein n=1 Tax=Rhizophora mucronata TaxID=61149 RepID=A0A2P2JPA1_RHIMU